MVCGFVFLCSVIALYYAYIGLGWLGFAVFGMVFYSVPGYMLAQMAAGEIAYARLRTGAGPPGKPKWTQRAAARARSTQGDQPDDDGAGDD